MGRELPSSPTEGLFTGYRFPTLSYTSSSQITILPYTWSLEKVPLSGGASPYRPLSGKYPPGLEATALTFKVQQSLSFRLSYGLQTEMISFLRYLFPGGIQDFKWRGSVIEWGQIQNPRIPQGFQQNPKKYLDQKLTQKMPCRISEQVCLYLFANSLRFHDIYRDYYHESSDCFEYPKKSLLQIRPPKKNTCQILLPPKKFRNRNFQIHKILPSSPSLEIRSTPPPRICLYKAYIIGFHNLPLLSQVGKNYHLIKAKHFFYFKEKKIPQFRNAINGLENNTRLIPLNLLICRKSLFFYCVKDEKEENQ